MLLTDGAFGQREHLAQIAGGQLGQPAVGDHQVGQRLFSSSIISSIFLFEGAGADGLVICNVRRCPIRKRPVLVLDRRVEAAQKRNFKTRCA